MSGKIERFNSVTGAITLTASASTSPKINFGPAAGGIFVVDSLDTASKIDWYVALSPEDTAAQIYDCDIALSTSVTAGQAYAIPDALFGAPFVVGVTDAGTATIRLSVKG